jgi:ABC-2 type transport system permease protein
MLNNLKSIIIKEVKEMIRDPRILLGMIIVPLLIFPVMGLGMSTATTSIRESTEYINVGYINQDTGNMSTALLAFISQNRTITLINITDTGTSIDKIITQSNHTKYNVIMVIPSNFSQDISIGNASKVELYTSLKSFGISEGLPSSQISPLINTFSQLMLYQRLNTTYPGKNATTMLNPVMTSEKSIVNGRIVDYSPMAIVNTITMQSTMSPIVIMILIIMASQLVAMSVAMEKEDKTLETLLTLPVSRMSILIGKLSGGIVIAGIACITYLLGFTYYMNTLSSFGGSSASSIPLADIGIKMTLVGYAMLGITLFLSIIAAMAIAVLLAAFTEDVRSAQSLVGIIYIPVFVPAFVLMFAPIETLNTGVQTVLYALPFSYPVLAVRALYTANYTIVTLGIIYQLIFSLIMVYLAARFINTEKILTAKIVLRKKSKVKEL